MHKKVLTHEDCVKLVCAVCTNLHGKKASRGVSEEDTRIIQKFIYAGYRRDCPSLPQGICSTCQPDLVRLKKSEEGKDSSGKPNENEGNREKALRKGD